MKKIFRIWLRRKIASGNYFEKLDELEECFNWLLAGSMFSIPLRIFCLNKEFGYVDKADELYRWIIGESGQ